MSSDKLQRLESRVASILPELKREWVCGALVVWCDPEQVVDTLRTMRDDPGMNFKLFIDVTAVHYPKREKPFEVVYQLLSVHKNHRIRVKTLVDADTPVPSITGLWKAADWFEREMYEMFGILISGHPDLRRLLLDYDFDGFPLRKDFPVTGPFELRYDETQQRIVREPVSLTVPNRNFYSNATGEQA
ncbi:NADH dehydrogenase subunit C [Magnetococcus marinus MC-1]|uniref:NADH-quinone oxidoreductase subunit C n=1 Tax=Magnetococcus marinus (strain ATCC BAA-1437 / JCM 17883 / MC-1) TaxID=156889 RepID=A0LDS5_MAGMM|nr:NADH-quinone oxidoreductase subunit C [Magnetococcus marinus]ABK46118.1 NADH dehydrogenase subunit C [Magnetococcus marinus MC-1]